MHLLRGRCFSSINRVRSVFPFHVAAFPNCVWLSVCSSRQFTCCNSTYNKKSHSLALA